MNTQNEISFADPVATLVATRWGWKDSTQEIVQQIWGHLTALGGAGSRFRGEVDALRALRRYTQEGLKEAMQDAVKREFAPAYRRADAEGRNRFPAPTLTA